jgi:xanthine dehydrogenase accessory factor
MRTLIATVRAWEEDGVDVGRAVVVRTFGSAPRPEGATLLVAADGRIAGSVSGGCVEGAAAEEIARARRDGVARVVRYGISDEQAWDVGLACGGTLDVLVEPLVRPEILAAAASPGARAIAVPLPPDAPPAAFGAHVTGPGVPPAAALVVDADGSVSAGTLGDAAADAALGAAAARRLAEGRSGVEEVRVGEQVRQVFVEVFPARPRLVVIGAVQVAIPLVALARTVGYETVVIDGRAAFATAERFPDVDRLVLGWPDEVADEVGLGPGDAVAVLTHDPKFDEPAIVAALDRGCRYVGAVGSRRTQADRRARLRAAGVTEEDLARLAGPIGLDLGGRSPEETALAILAEVVAARHGASGRPLALLASEREAAAARDAAAADPAAADAASAAPHGPDAR